MLDHPTRQRILAFIRDHPATSGRAVQRGVGLGWGDTLYQIGLLTREGAIVRIRGGRRDFLFVAGSEVADRPVLTAMQSRIERAILVTVARRGPLTFGEIVGATRERKSSVAFHLRVLLAGTLLVPETDGSLRRYRVRAPGLVLKLYDAFKDSFEETWSETFATIWGGLTTQS